MPRRTPVSVLAGVLCAAMALTVAPSSPAAAATAASQLATAPDHQVRAELGAAMADLVAHGATGAVVLVDDGTTVTQLSAGRARLDPKEPLRPVAQARVGSITKTFVATVVLQLVSEGRLSLDDSLDTWLPGLVPGGADVTVRQLLQHTSGVDNYTEDAEWFEALLTDPAQTWTPHQLVRIAVENGPDFDPGTSWSYSNTGYILLGLLLRKVTGEHVDDLILRRIVRPLKLTRTFLPVTTPAFTGPYAHGYIPPDLVGRPDWWDFSGYSPSWAWTAGALVSNAADLSAFYEALLSGRLLPAELLAEMTAPHSASVPYGLGLETLPTACGERILGHSGHVPGYLSFAFADRTGTRSTVVLVPTELTDVSFPALAQLLDVATCAMTGERVPPAEGLSARSFPMVIDQLDVAGALG